MKHVDAEEQKAIALTKAAIESMRLLGLSPAESAAALGVPPGAFTALRKGERSVDGYTGEAEAADALVRTTKRLSALLGPEETKWRSWLRRPSAALGARPLDLILQRHGAVNVAEHLERGGPL